MSDDLTKPVPADSPPATVSTPPPSPHECDTASGIVAPPAPAEQPLPPELVNHSRYRIMRILGVGGMGTVYQAEHRVMERCVALKVIRTDLVSNAGAVDRFKHEVKAAAKLNHPNIVDAFDAEQVGNLHFLVMEYVDGKDLAHVVAERGPLPVDEACNYVGQAAMGLQHAFERGMIHRDIKPQNLMLTGWPDAPLEYRTVKILDFGLARFANATSSGHTASGTLLGTVDFMAPEQADDARSVDIRADVYSLGCTLYYLLAGRTPFPTGTLVQKVMCHVERTPASLTNFRKDMPPSLLDVIHRMMAKQPEDRYQTPGEVVQALAPFHPGYFLTGSHTAIPAFSAVKPGAHGLMDEPPSTIEMPPPDVPHPKSAARTFPRLRRLHRRIAVTPTLLIGCFTLMGLLIVTCGVVVYYAIQLSIENNGLQTRGWDHVERNWTPPSENTPRENLFPQQWDEYELQKVDEQADLPALNIRVKGRHALYKAGNQRMELFIYRVSELEKEALYRHVLNALEKQKGKKSSRQHVVTGTPEDARLTFHLEGEKGKGAVELHQRGVLWWNRGWLFLLQTEPSMDPEPLLLKYLERFNTES